MKSVTAFVLASILSLAVAMNVGAQSTESIWLAASANAYKTGETLIVTVNAASATPIQGFTFQIRYDPACVKPVNAASTVPGMNGLFLPQTSGLVDASYASTTPQPVNGVLAEVRFTTLGGCQTNLTLESAALAIRNPAGFAAPLAGVTIGQRDVALSIDKTLADSQSDQPMAGSVLALDPPPAAHEGIPMWLIAVVAMVAVAGGLFGVRLFRNKPLPAAQKSVIPSGIPSLQVKHGQYAGRSFALKKLPCLIGRDPQSDICLNDPHILGRHAKIFAGHDGYYLVSLGGETFVNGRAVQKSYAMLKTGDVVRLGKSALFVFG